MSELTSNAVEHSDLKRIEYKGKEIILIGTAHISKVSAELVKEVIEKEKPDTVCVELDERRYKSLKEKTKWENIDLKEVIRNKQLSTLIINILLASYQKKLGEKMGVAPGTELVEAINSAEKYEIPFVLSDRDVRTTLKRTWRTMGLWQKLKFAAMGLGSLFENEEVDEVKLSELREKDVMTEMFKEMGEVMPQLKRVLIDERDKYLAEKIRTAEGNKIVAVVGAGHVNGITETILNEEPVNLEEIEVIPPPSPVGKIIGWLIPALIVASIVYIGFEKGNAEAGENILYWILANGISSGIGAILAAAHPLAILAAVFSAPLTSLTPLIGAGIVAALVQVYFSPPKVKEFQSVTDDINKTSKWWKNRLLKTFLVLILVSLGSNVGSILGIAEIIKTLFN